MTGGHTVAGVINWDYLALKVGIFIDSQKLSSIFHLSLNHFVHPAKKIKKGNCCQKSTFSRLTERPTSKFGVTLMGSQEASMPGVVGKNIIFQSIAWHLFERIHCPGTSTMSAMGLPWMLTGTT